MKVLITGSTGYLGSVLVPALMAAGHEVTELIHERNTSYNTAQVAGTVNSRDDLLLALEGQEAVIHLAAVVGNQAVNRNTRTAVQTNYEATKMLAELCRDQGKRLIFASTCSVYGAKKGAPLNEEASLDPVDLYGITKKGAEEAIQAVCKDYVILRMGTLHGLSPRMRFDLVANKFVGQGVQDGHVQVFGGDQWRPLLALTEAVPAYLGALKSGQGTYNVGGQNYRIFSLACRIADGLKLDFNQEVRIKVASELKDDRDYVVSSEKAIAEWGLNFPERSMTRTLQDVYGFLEAGHDYKSPEYTNENKEYKL